MGTRVLTSRQAQVWEMSRKQGMNLREISDRLGITYQSVSSALKGALRKLTAGKLVPLDDEVTLKLDNPAERLAALFGELERVLADPSDATTIRLAQDVRVRSLAMADNVVMAQATGPQLVQMAQGATNIIQLLKGEPTAITKFLDMRNMKEVMEMFRKEAARRERLAVVDVTPEEAG